MDIYFQNISNLLVNSHKPAGVLRQGFLFFMQFVFCMMFSAVPLIVFSLRILTVPMCSGPSVPCQMQKDSALWAKSPFGSPPFSFQADCPAHSSGVSDGSACRHPSQPTPALLLPGPGRSFPSKLSTVPCRRIMDPLPFSDSPFAAYTKAGAHPVSCLMVHILPEHLPLCGFSHPRGCLPLLPSFSSTGAHHLKP